MTRPQCHNVKVETIERKVVVGAAIQKMVSFLTTLKPVLVTQMKEAAMMTLLN